MMARVKISFLLISALLGSTFISHTRSFVAKSRGTLKNEITSHRYVIVMFYDSRHGDDFDQLAAFSNLGDDDLYEAAGLKFVQADVAYGGIAQFARQFDLDEGKLPAFVLFKHGRPLRNKKTHKVIMMRGRHNSQGIVDFIDAHFGKDFQAIRKRLEAEQRRKTVVYYPSYYASPYYGPYYGYYGYPYYWYSPYYGGYYGPYGGGGVSFGFSVGTGW